MENKHLKKREKEREVIEKKQRRKQLKLKSQLKLSQWIMDKNQPFIMQPPCNQGKKIDKCT